MQSPSSTGPGDGKGADSERGPGLPSGPQQDPQVISDDEAFDDTPPPVNILSHEEEQMGLWTHVVPGTRSDGEDIETFGEHPWHRQFLHGWISGKKGGGRKGAYHQWMEYRRRNQEAADELARQQGRLPTGRHRPGWQTTKGKGRGRKGGKGWNFANWDDRKREYHSLWQNRAEEE